MTRGAKMLMVSRTPDRRIDYPGMTYPSMTFPRMNYPAADYEPPSMGYSHYSADPEKNWDSTNYGDTEARFRDRRGREHYDNGRYAPRSAMEKEYGTHVNDVWNPTLVPPVYRGTAMNRIGFAANPETEIKRDYHTEIAYPHMNEVGHHTSDMDMGYANGGDMALTEDMAEEWMDGLHNEDGTKGAHWTLDQVKQVMGQRGIKGDTIEYWVILNSLYSDYCGVLKKHNANNMDVYVDMAAAWLKDKDAVDNKAAKYFHYIVK